MPFAYPATELFKNGKTRVVWSLEEYEQATEKDGWQDERPAPKQKPAKES